MLVSRLILICMISVSATTMNTTDGALDLSIDVQETISGIPTAPTESWTEWGREHEVEEIWEDMGTQEKKEEWDEGEDEHEEVQEGTGGSDWAWEVLEDKREDREDTREAIANPGGIAVPVGASGD